MGRFTQKPVLIKAASATWAGLRKNLYSSRRRPQHGQAYAKVYTHRGSVRSRSRLTQKSILIEAASAVRTGLRKSLLVVCPSVPWRPWRDEAASAVTQKPALIKAASAVTQKPALIKAASAAWAGLRKSLYSSRQRPQCEQVCAKVC